MAIKSSRWKQQSFHSLMLMNHDHKSDSDPPVSHDEGNSPSSSVRTRAMSSRKSVYSRNVVLMKMSLFFLVSVLSNFHVSFGSKHEPVFNHDHRHSNHHRHHNHHLHHKHGEGGIRTCSHQPPKPEEVRHSQKIFSTCSERTRNKINCYCFQQKMIIIYGLI